MRRRAVCKRIRVLWALIFCHFISIPAVCLGDETDIFSSADLNPDALILLDLSASMNQNPDGSGPLRGPATEDSKITLAKNAIKAILDVDHSGTIDAADESSLKIRIGYMRFYDCQHARDDAGTNYDSGCNSLIKGIASPYADIWTAIKNESASGGTPLAGALNEAKLYLDAHKDGDSAKACRQKFVILVTDGEDTFFCNGNGSQDQRDQYKRRKATVVKAKALFAAGYKVFVIGFGADMPITMKNTLNWAAYYGGTDNPLEANDPTLDDEHPPAVTFPGDLKTYNPCAEDPSNDFGNASLSGYAFVATNTAELNQALRKAFDAIYASRFSFSGTSVAASRASSDNFLYDASFQPVAGDPFWRGSLKKYSINGDGTLTELWDAASMLNGNTARNIKTYKSGLIDFEHNRVSNDDIGLQGGDAWQAVIAYIRGEATPDHWKLGDLFHSNPITIGKPNPYFNDPRDKNNKFAVFRSGQQTRAKIIVAGANDGQLHAFDGDGGSEVWSFIPPNLLGKLKFLAHSSHPTSLTHQFFVDGPISAADIWLGTGDGTAKGDNEWKTYIVFGEGKGVRNKNNEAAPLWSSSESCDSARPEDFSSTYTSNQYKYYCGPYLWSSSSSCDTGFSATYTPAYSHYCGYYAFDVTHTGSIPGYGWRINSDPVTGGTDISHGTYLGEPWSRMAIGRVHIGGNETWAGFIGGGYGQSGDAGKGFFVIDLKDGHILWSYTHTNYGIPASPAIVDTDNDGFVDTAYVGNLGGEMWKFTFCTQAQGSSCGTGNWNGGLLFRPSTTRPIFTTAAVARDSRSNLWIFWGTGDKTNPNSSTPGKFFAIKDSGNGTYYESDLPDISAYTDTSRGWSITLGSGGEKMLSDPTVFGGVLLFTTYAPYAGSNPCIKTGTSLLYALAMQKMSIGGKAYNTGAGLLTDPGGSTTRSVSLGLGIASTPIISQRSGGGTPDIFVSVSGGIKEDGTTTTTQPTQIKSNADLNAASPLIQRLAQTAPYPQLLHWKDGRIQ